MSFQQDIAAVVNRYGMEGSSNTPDYVLAQFMTDCMSAFNAATRARDEHTVNIGALQAEAEIALDVEKRAHGYTLALLQREKELCDRLGDALVSAERWVNQPCAVKAEAEKSIAAWKEARR